MKIKVCGLHPIRDVQLCIDLKINFLGFVFYKKSPRNLNIDDIDVLKTYNKLNSSFVAVSVNPSDEFIQNVVLGNFDYIQLHGSETQARVAEIKAMGLKVIKAIKVNGESDIKNYEKYSNADGMMEAAIAPGLYLGIRGRVLLDCEAVIVCVVPSAFVRISVPPVGNVPVSGMMNALAPTVGRSISSSTKISSQEEALSACQKSVQFSICFGGPKCKCKPSRNSRDFSEQPHFTLMLWKCPLGLELEK